MTSVDEASVRFTSTPTAGDIHANAATLSRDSLVSTGGGVFLLLLGGTAFLLGDPFSLLVALVGVSLLTGLVAAPLVWWAIRKRGDLMLQPVKVEADGGGISFEAPLASSRHAWTVFRRVRETSRAFAFDTGAGTTVVLATRGAAPEDLDAFRRLLAERGLLVHGSRRGRLLRRGLAAAIGAVLAALVVFGPQLIGLVGRTARLELTVSVSGSIVTVAGSTDLPDGTIVGLQVLQLDEWNREIADGAQPAMDDWAWQAYAEAVVRGGQVHSTASTAGWPAGRGLAVGYFWIDSRQPAEVIDRFGRDGRELRGPDVVEDPQTGRTLKVSASFDIRP